MWLEKEEIIRPKIPCWCLFPKLPDHWPYKHQDSIAEAFVLPGERGTSIRNLIPQRLWPFSGLLARKPSLPPKKMCKSPWLAVLLQLQSHLSLTCLGLCGTVVRCKARVMNSVAKFPGIVPLTKGPLSGVNDGGVGIFDNQAMVKKLTMYRKTQDTKNMLYSLMGALECQTQTVNPKDKRDSSTWGVRSWKTSQKGHPCDQFFVLFLLHYFCFHSMSYK